MRSIPPYWILYLAMISVGMGQSVIFAVMPMLGRELALDKLMLALPWLDWQFQPKELAITALSALTAFTFSMISPFWGRLSDRIGRKPVIVVGLLGYTVGVSLFSLVAWLGLTSVLTGIALYLLLMLTRLIHSLVMSASFPASSAYMVDISLPTARAKALGRLAAFMQIGVMCGPALAYLMMYGYLMPFLAQACITFAVGMLIVFRFPHHKPAVAVGKRKKLGYFGKPYRVYLGLALLFYIGMGMVQQTLGFYFQDVLHIAAVDAARAYAFAMMFSSASMLLAQFGIVQRLNVRPQLFIRAGFPFAVAGFIVLALAESQLQLSLGMALFGFAMGLVGPSITASASLTVDAQDQGALAGLVGSVAGLGFVFGPLLGGAIYALSIHLPYYLAAATLLLAALYVTLKVLPGEIILVKKA